MATKPVTCLWEAAQQGDLEKVDQYLTGTITERDQLALHYAAQKGHTEVIRALIRHGFDVNKPAKNNNTPLHLAAQNGFADAVKVLLENKADPLALSATGTPAHVAKTPAVKELIENFIRDSASSSSSSSSPASVPATRKVSMDRAPTPAAEPPKPRDDHRIISLALEENWDAIAKLATTLMEVPSGVHNAIPLHSALQVEQEFNRVHVSASVAASDKAETTAVKLSEATDSLAAAQLALGEDQREVERLEAELARAREALTKSQREVSSGKVNVDQLTRRLAVERREAEKYADVVAKEEKKITDISRQLEDFKEKLSGGDLGQLTTNDVAMLLNELKMGRYKDKFAKEKVNGKVLEQLSEGDLKTDLGIENLSDRKRLLAQLQRIRTRTVEIPISGGSRSGGGGVGASRWGVNQVVEWLTKLDMAEYAKKFRDEQITGDVLLTLTSDDLRNYLKMERLGDRISIIEGIKKLQEEVNELSNQVHHDDL